MGWGAVIEPREGRSAMWRTVSVLVLTMLAVGCGPSHDGSMVSVVTPRDWAVGLERQRGLKDDYFRRGADTPLSAEAKAVFEGLEYWEPDPGLYFVGDLRRHPNPQQFEIVTTSGQERPCERFGWVSFPIDGEVRTLQVYRLLDIVDEWEGLLLPFRDATTGTETYPAGRYLDLEGPPGGPYVLDFNRAYNPSCAYGDVARFACPVTPPENRLEVRVEAGERGYVADAS